VEGQSREAQEGKSQRSKVYSFVQKFSKVCSPTIGDYKIGYDLFLEHDDDERR
jgi:hypothetical protein